MVQQRLVRLLVGLDRAFDRRRIRVFFWFLLVVVGLWDSWFYRNHVEIYGYHYLDVGDAIMAGNWPDAANSYWAPLFSLIQSVVNRAIRPPVEHEFLLVHLVCLGIYLCVFRGFEFFIDSLIELQRKPADSGGGLPEAPFRAACYSLFAWFTLEYQVFPKVTPDVMIGGIFIVLLVLVIRVRIDPLRWGHYLLFGLFLGLGFLSKAVMFPMGGVAFLVLSWVSWRGIRSVRPAALRLCVSIALSLAIASPYLIGLHARYDRWTYGDSGSLTYLWLVNRATRPYEFGSRTPPENGEFLHPPRLLSAKVQLFEFATPISGTYPVFFDPAYWHEGVRPVYRTRDLVDSWSRSLKWIWIWLKSSPFVIIFALLLLSLPARLWCGIRENAFLLAPSSVGLLLFFTVFLDMRHIWAYLVLLGSLLLSAVWLRERFDQWATKAITPFFIGFLLFGVGNSRVESVRSMDWSHFPQLLRDSSNHLASLGLMDGDAIAVIGGSGTFGSLARYWRKRIVAACPPNTPARFCGEFWTLTEGERLEIVRKLQKVGVSAVVAFGPPEFHAPAGWTKVSSGRIPYVGLGNLYMLGLKK